MLCNGGRLQVGSRLRFIDDASICPQSYKPLPHWLWKSQRKDPRTPAGPASGPAQSLRPAHWRCARSRSGARQRRGHGSVQIVKGAEHGRFKVRMRMAAIGDLTSRARLGPGWIDAGWPGLGSAGGRDGRMARPDLRAGAAAERRCDNHNQQQRRRLRQRACCAILGFHCKACSLPARP